MIKKLICSFLLAACCLNANTQQLYDSLLNELHSNYPQEKIYIQLDKSFYNPSETIWFKAYITADNVAGFISKTMYAELINEKGKVLQRKIMPILQAGAASHFELADSNYQSKLFIRAYTAWMLNFDSTFIYVKPVTVINPSVPNKIKTIEPNYTLTFFPEGGDLIANLSGRVAFKTNDHNGIPFSVSGNILDLKGNIVCSFKSTHNGMGFFYIQPLPRERYRAVWKDVNGLQHETALPIAQLRGISLSMQIVNGEFVYSIARPDSVSDENKQLVVLGQINQQTVYAAKINLKVKTKITASIAIDSLPDGIMQVTVFNAAQVPLAERIVFVNNGSYSFNTDLKIVEKNITQKGKNVLQLDVGGNLKSNLSIAITDAGLDAKDANKTSVFSELLLSSDLKGFIYQPAYYFLSDEDSVKQQLDLVMMTNGWRRFNWEKLIAKQLPVIKYQPDNYLSIAGNVYGLSKFQLADKSLTGILQSTVAGGNKSFVTIPINVDGSFNYPGVYFFDTIKLYYQFNNDKNKVLTEKASFDFNTGIQKSPPLASGILLANFFSFLPDNDVLQKNKEQFNFYQSQLKMQKVKTLETVTIVGKQKSLQEKMDQEYASGMFTSGNARIFTTDDDPFAQSAISVLDYLKGKVAGLEISTSGADGGSITRRGSATDIFLNENNADINLIQSIQMTDVAMIKVFDPPFFGSMGGGPGGAVAVYTKKGGGTNPNIKGLNATTLYGYSGIKEFYKPNYENTTADDVKDIRTTLYWNPFLLMDAKNRRITIPFYNNDSGKKIRVIIEGINEAGQLTRKEKIFE